MKNNRLIAILLVLVLTVSLLAGCGGGNSEAPETTPDEATPAPADTAAPEDEGSSGGSAEPVTIWYYWETEGHQVALDKVIKDYNASQDKYEVTAKYVPFADFKKQLSIGASADELPDIAILDSPDHASYAAMGIFEDITGNSTHMLSTYSYKLSFEMFKYSKGSAVANVQLVILLIVGLFYIKVTTEGEDEQ